MNRKHTLFAVLAAALLTIALSVPAFAMGGSTTITAKVEHGTIIIPIEPPSPQTGDEGVSFYIVSALLSGVGAGSLLHRRKRK